MKKKIMKVMLLISSLLLILFGVITLQALGRVRTILLTSSEKTGEQTAEYSDVAVRDQLIDRLKDTNLGCAYVLNETLNNYADTVSMIAGACTDMYSNPDKYGRTEVRIPDKSDIGKSMGIALYAEGVDPEDEAIVDELGILGNQKGNLLAMYDQYKDLGAASIGTETGIMLLAGPVLPERWDKDGNYGYLDPRTRPWYTLAKDNNKVTFTDIEEDYDTGKLALMCGAPIYRGKTFVGVAAAGMYLEEIETMMMNANIGLEGNSCIIDKYGVVIFSSREDGELKVQTLLGEGSSSDKALSELAQKAANGESGMELLEIDGENSYLAYSPIEAVGWSLISIIPERTVLAPRESLLASLEESSRSELIEVQKVFKTALMVIFSLIVAMGILTLIAARLLSKELVKPVELLTEKVQDLQGDQLDFSWDINTGDEVQKLAETFGSMTERMKAYINDIQTATAEKERMGVELGLATKIQASMLPHKFPPFPDRKEFDIFASMDPAKEVGGDFYDFFLVDEDHLGLVMADVSGKGIPAALFMMASKIILQSCAMLGKSAAEVLNKTNEALTYDNQTGMFVTVWFGILEISTGKISCANAGHEYPAIKRKDGSFELYKDKHGLVIGGMEGIKYKEYTLELGHGDKLFLYTDGVPEATDSDTNMFGTDRMIEALNIDPNAAPQQILKNVRQAVDDFVKDAEQFDDLTMMCFEYK